MNPDPLGPWGEESTRLADERLHNLAVFRTESFDPVGNQLKVDCRTNHKVEAKVEISPTRIARIVLTIDSPNGERSATVIDGGEILEGCYEWIAKAK